MSEWMFLSNHAMLLILIARNSHPTIEQLAKDTSASKKSVRQMITELCDAGYINKKIVGRNVSYQINHNLAPQHINSHEVGIDDFLSTMNYEKKTSLKTSL